MSLFGKILAFANVVVAILFVILAAMDWGARQRWTYAVYRHDLAIEGIPVDAEVKGTDGEPLVDNFTEQTRQELFQPVGGNPVRTQVEEVERVRNQVAQYLDDANVPGTRAQKLARILMPFAQTFSRREELRQRMENPALDQPPDDLQAELDALFDDVLQKRRAPQEKRRVIANLLFNLAGTLEEPPQPNASPLTSPAYQRMLVVVGLEAAVGEVQEDAVALRELTQDGNEIIERERIPFLEAHRAMLQQILLLAQEVEDRKQFLASQQEASRKNQEVVNNRREDVRILTEKLNEIRRESQIAMARQTEREGHIFAAQRKARDTLRENLELHGKINELIGQVNEREQAR